MKRRDVLKVLTGAMLAAPGAAAAQTATKVYRVGTLTVGPPIPPNAGTGAMLDRAGWRSAASRSGRTSPTKLAVRPAR